MAENAMAENTMTETAAEGISLKGIFSLELIRKEQFSGSYRLMRYRLMMEDGKMKASVYPEPYCWEVTPEEQKESEYFEYSVDGIEQMTAWLNQKYQEKQAEQERGDSGF